MMPEHRVAVSQTGTTLNINHKYSGIKYITPEERHQSLDEKILAARKSGLLISLGAHPEH